MSMCLSQNIFHFTTPFTHHQEVLCPAGPRKPLASSDQLSQNIFHFTTPFTHHQEVLCPAGPRKPLASSDQLPGTINANNLPSFAHTNGLSPDKTFDTTRRHWRLISEANRPPWNVVQPQHSSGVVVAGVYQPQTAPID